MEQSLTCVVIPLQPPVDTMCIDSYLIEVLDEGNNPVGNGTTIGAATEVTVCSLNLCQGPLTFRAHSNGEELGSMTDTTTSSYTATLPSGLRSLPLINELYWCRNVIIWIASLLSIQH